MNQESIFLPKKLSNKESDAISDIFTKFETINELNLKMEELTGIKTFFRNNDDFVEFQNYLNNPAYFNFSDKLREHGDYQTPLALTDKICNYLVNIGCSPDIIIEPTYGMGSFIKSSLDFFPNAKCIYGVEIQKKYEWKFKISLLKRVVKSKRSQTTIDLHLDNIFTHVFPKQLKNPDYELLILGNPPWVTSSELSALGSNNIPQKSNIKNFAGLDAITGKSNFDIAEFIILKMLETFSTQKGTMAFICKNIVIRNIVKELPKRRFKISDLKALGIDAKKEFGASCDASVFIAKLGKLTNNYICESSLFEYPNKNTRTFGWVNDKFVSDVNKYSSYIQLDGHSPLIWRSGIKHDCSKVLELMINNGNLMNGFGEKVEIENELLYPVLKSSEIKGFEISKCKRVMIVTQHKVNESTSYIAINHPKTWRYLMSKAMYFDQRKSSIYKNRPKFSIFGIGDYSFMPYKVAISGLYKKPTFSLIPPIYGKPVMFDDTCYFLSFESYKNALFSCSILNSEIVYDFLESLVFLDSKRVYTKDLLMRIDLCEVANRLSFNEIKNSWRLIDFQHYDKYCESDYNEFKKWLSCIKDETSSSVQMPLHNYEDNIVIPSKEEHLVNII